MTSPLRLSAFIGGSKLIERQQLVVRRDFLARILRIGGRRVCLIAQRRQFTLQLFDLRLLAINGLVQFFEHVFSQAQLGFYFFEAGFQGGSTGDSVEREFRLARTG